MERTDLKTQLAEVAERIRTMREIMGLSEEEMARCTGISKEEYQECERGGRDFSFTFIYKCAGRFAIDPTDLIKGVSPTLSSYTVSRKGDGLRTRRLSPFTSPCLTQRPSRRWPLSFLPMWGRSLTLSSKAP